MPEKLRLGVIGMSPGNGHPYSWSAICNGYDPISIEDCGFPVIPRYLKVHRYPDDFIQIAKVTHVWTQSKQLSLQIAKACNITYVANDFTDLIGLVDAVLLARDDAENHLRFAKPFLEAGIPIYIDKPLALSVVEAKELLGLQQYPGQIFSCSALRYANELMPSSSDLRSIGAIRTILGFTPKDWDKYSVHVIDPLLRLVPEDDEVLHTTKWESDDRTNLHLQFSSGIDALVGAYGDCILPISLKIIGSFGFIDLELCDTFNCFKNALQDFLVGVNERSQRIADSSMLRVVSIIEAGRTS